MLIFWEDQRVASVAERLQIGHQLDIMLATGHVQFQDILAAQGTAAGPNLGMARELEGMLGIELQDIELVVAQLLGQMLERVQPGHFAPGDVEHQATAGERGPVPNGHIR